MKIPQVSSSIDITTAIADLTSTYIECPHTTILTLDKTTLKNIDNLGVEVDAFEMGECFAFIIQSTIASYQLYLGCLLEQQNYANIVQNFSSTHTTSSLSPHILTTDYYSGF